MAQNDGCYTLESGVYSLKNKQKVQGNRKRYLDVFCLYGIKSCDTCRKAMKMLIESGRDVTFRDVREEPLTRETTERFLADFGEKLINDRSTTWRNLTETEKNHAPVDLLVSHPTLMKRPVIEGEDHLTLGWDKTVQAYYLG